VARAVVLVTVLAVVLAGGTVLDHRIRVREEAQVAGCVRSAASAVRYSSARVDAILGYVRPTLESNISGSVRRRMAGLLSLSVAPTVPGVRRARDRCSGVRTWWFHKGVRTTQRDCLTLLTADLAYLDRITRDGLAAFATRSLPTHRCVPQRPAA